MNWPEATSEVFAYSQRLCYRPLASPRDTTWPASLFNPNCFHRIQRGGFASRKPASKKPNQDQNRGNSHKDRWIGRRDADGKTRHDSSYGESRCKAKGEPRKNLPETALHDQHHDVARIGSQCHAHPDLLCTAAGGMCNYSVQADRSHQQRNQSKSSEHLGQKREEPLLMLNCLIQDRDFAQGKVRIDACNCCAQSSGYIHARFDEQVHPVPAFLPEREKEQRRGVFVIQVLDQVTGNSNYSDPVSSLVVVVIKAKTLSNRRLVRPEPCRALPGENGGLVAVRSIGVVEVAAQQERQTDGVEVTGRL